MTVQREWGAGPHMCIDSPAKRQNLVFVNVIRSLDKVFSQGSLAPLRKTARARSPGGHFCIGRILLPCVY